MAKPLPKHPTLTPMRALYLLLDVVEDAGRIRGKGERTTSCAHDRTIRELTDHVKAALVRRKRKR